MILFEDSQVSANLENVYKVYNEICYTSYASEYEILSVLM